MEKKYYKVVAGVVINHGLVLCMRKGATRYDYTSHKWEFPGGKIESGESTQAALHRVLLEELELEVEVGEHLITVTHEYPDFGIVMSAYACRALSPHLVLTEHEASEWVSPAELMSLTWCAADVPIAQKVQNVCNNCDN